MTRWHTPLLLTLLIPASFAAAETRLDPAPTQNIVAVVEALAPLSGVDIPIVLGHAGLAYHLTWNADTASFAVSHDGKDVPTTTCIDDAGRISFAVIEADRMIHGAVNAWQVGESGTIRLVLTIAPNDGQVVRLAGTATPIPEDDVGSAALISNPPFEPGSARYRMVWDLEERCVCYGAENPTVCTYPQCERSAACGNPATGRCTFTNRACPLLGATQGSVVTLPILTGWMVGRRQRTRRRGRDARGG